jgi:hypothetical protein
MNLQNFISFTPAAIAVNVNTPIDAMFSSNNFNLLIIFCVKTILAGLIGVAINKLTASYGAQNVVTVLKNVVNKLFKSNTNTNG